MFSRELTENQAVVITEGRGTVHAIRRGGKDGDITHVTVKMPDGKLYFCLAKNVEPVRRRRVD